MRTTAAVALALVLFAGPAWAISVQEVIDLARAQIGDEIIVAKIKADRSTFTLGAKDILELKNAGVSDKVILAMVEAERPPLGTPSPAAASQPAPTYYAPEPSGASDYGYQPASQPATYQVVQPVYRTVYVPSYSTWSYDSGCSSYYPSYSYYPRVYRSYGCDSWGGYGYRGSYWGPSYGFSYSHRGRRSSWGVHFGW